MTETGFSNTAIDASLAFRCVMQAMARPGRPVRLDMELQAPAPLQPTSAAVALTLCDFQTPIWLSPGLRTDAVARYLKFHAGAPISEQAERAQFIFLSAGEEIPALAVFAQGTHEYPDRSATLVIQTDGFHTGSAVLSGPGIKPPLDFGVNGLSEEFWEAMASNHQRFPIGVDVIFTGPDVIAALPRSAAITLKETV